MIMRVISNIQYKAFENYEFRMKDTSPGDNGLRHFEYCCIYYFIAYATIVAGSQVSLWYIKFSSKCSQQPPHKLTHENDIWDVLFEVVWGQAIITWTNANIEGIDHRWEGSYGNNATGKSRECASHYLYRFIVEDDFKIIAIETREKKQSLVVLIPYIWWIFMRSSLSYQCQTISSLCKYLHFLQCLL